VRDGLEARLRWLFGGVAVVLVATGAYALLVTSTTEPAQAAADAQLRALVAALLAASSAAFALLGARVVWAPRRNTHVMPVFALAALCAFAFESGAALHAWHGETSWIEPASVAGVSLVLGLASALGWLTLWLAERPGVATARRDAALFDALLATLIPRDDELALDASDGAVRARVLASFAARSTRRRPALRLALRTLDAVALVNHRCRFDAADQALRERIVAGLAIARRPRLRALGATLDEIVLGAFWSDERVRLAVGDDPSRVPALLETGPNAASHRARREAAEQAARDLALAAEALASSHEPATDQADSLAPLTAHDSSVLETPPAELADGQAQAAVAQTNPVAVDKPTGHKPASSSTSDGPHEITPPTEDAPFDRRWTFGTPAQEATPRPAMGPVLRVARAGGPTRR
jgi:hypothetical protein